MNFTNRLNSLVLFFLALVISIGCNSFESSEKNTLQKDTDNDGDFVVTGNSADPEITMDEVTPETDLDVRETTKNKATQNNNRKQTNVKFGKGKTSRAYENSVIRGEKHTYTLAASKGQMMSIQINSLEDNANFVVIGPGDGFPIAGTSDSGVKSFDDVLRTDGKYKVIVTPIRGNARFKINFSIK